LCGGVAFGSLSGAPQFPWVGLGHSWGATSEAQHGADQGVGGARAARRSGAAGRCGSWPRARVHGWLASSNPALCACVWAAQLLILIHVHSCSAPEAGFVWGCAADLVVFGDLFVDLLCVFGGATADLICQRSGLATEEFWP